MIFLVLSFWFSIRIVMVLVHRVSILRRQYWFSTQMVTLGLLYYQIKDRLG